MLHTYGSHAVQGQRPPRREERKRIRKLTQPAAGRQHISAEDIREELFGRDDGDDGKTACTAQASDPKHVISDWQAGFDQPQFATLRCRASPCVSAGLCW